MKCFLLGMIPLQMIADSADNNKNMNPDNIQDGTAVEFEIVEIKGKNQAPNLRKMH